MPENKKIKDTALGAWLSSKAPSLASKVGDLLPDRGVLGIVKNLVGGEPNISPEDMLEFEQLKMQQEISAQEQVTRRWEADSKGDVQLSKYIRPASLIALTSFYMIVTVWDGLDDDFTPPEIYIRLLELLMLTVFGAYFAGRTIEKVKR